MSITGTRIRALLIAETPKAIRIAAAKPRTVYRNMANGRKEKRQKQEKLWIPKTAIMSQKRDGRSDWIQLVINDYIGPGRLIRFDAERFTVETPT